MEISDLLGGTPDNTFIELDIKFSYLITWILFVRNVLNQESKGSLNPYNFSL